MKKKNLKMVAGGLGVTVKGNVAVGGDFTMLDNTKQNQAVNTFDRVDYDRTIVKVKTSLF